VAASEAVGSSKPLTEEKSKTKFNGVEEGMLTRSIEICEFVVER
jgi:hypothetical protein